MPAQAEATAHRPLYGFRDVLRYEAGLVGAALTGALHAAPTLMMMASAPGDGRRGSRRDRGIHLPNRASHQRARVAPSCATAS